MSPRSRGICLGAAAAVATGVALSTWGAADREHPPWSSHPPWWVAALGWLTIAIPVGTYLAAFVLAVRRSTRRFGLWVLLGITVTLPFVLFLAAAWSLAHGQGS